MAKEGKTPVLDELKVHVAKLHCLLAEPHPGLFTWTSMAGHEWKAIVDLWNADDSATPEAK